MPKISFGNSLIKDFVIKGLVLSLFVLFVQNSSEIFSHLIKADLAFERTSILNWTTRVQNLQRGSYYLSLGRPRAACDIVLDGERIASNKSSNGELRSSLSLGAPFFINGEIHSYKLEISCDPQNGFHPGLSVTPVIAKHRLGVLLQIWRTFTEVILGPVMACFLFISLFLHMAKRDVKTTHFKSHLMFSVVAINYSLSLAHYPRLFLSGDWATWLHVLLRLFFSLSFINICQSYCKKTSVFLIAHFACAVLWSYVCFFIPVSADGFYSYMYLFFPIATFYGVFRLFKSDKFNSNAGLLKLIGIVWTFAQFCDAIQVWLNFGTYVAPAIVTLMSICMSVINFRERLVTDRIELSTKQILTVINGKNTPRELLAQLTMLSSNETHFTRASAYLDAFVLGQSETPRQTFVRVMQAGYKKDTSRDSKIDLIDGQGAAMSTAIEQNTLQLHKGKVDGSWYLNIPVGKHACINLSDDSPAEPYKAYESLEAIRRIWPALKTLDAKLLEYSLRQGSALEKLRSIYGDGQREVEVGAVFADINDYSVMSERYGNAFSEFVSSKYFPALVKAVGAWGAPEFVRGDEIYLVSVKDLIPANSTPEEAAFEAAQTIMNFSKNEGAELCGNSGFAPLRFSIGINVGMASLICDPIKVRTAGRVINEAKRLQEAAGKNAILVKADAAGAFALAHFVLGDEAPILIKKNIILARQVLGTRNVRAA